MSKFLDRLIVSAFLATVASPALAQGDAEAGAAVFKKCQACHMVGPEAANKVGPLLNDLVGRPAASVEGFKYSKAMKAAGEQGIAWTPENLAQYLANPKGFVKGTNMAFAGIKKEEEIANVIAYLSTFSQGAGEQESSAAPAVETAAQDAPPAQDQAAAGQPAPPAAETAKPAAEAAIPVHGVLHLGRPATEDEIAAWDIDIRPDGLGLPEGKGTVADGEVLYTDNCAVCHGDFGEAVDRWPVLAGGHGTLTAERPEKTIGSYWPYLSTVYDYVRRAMPFGGARTLSDDDVYAITAYLLYLNDVVTDEDFELSKENFASVRLPNEANFIDDNRAEEPHNKAGAEPCMTNCKPGPAEVKMRARILDVTPDVADDEDTENLGAGSVD